MKKGAWDLHIVLMESSSVLDGLQHTQIRIQKIKNIS